MEDTTALNPTLRTVCAHCDEAIDPGDACAGRMSYHRGCHTELDRAWRHSSEGHRRRSAIMSEYRRRHPDRIRARNAVHKAVKRGALPPAWACPCVSCGGQAKHWDHHNGYAPQHRLDVQPVCEDCHYERRRLRGEHRGQAANRAIVGYVREDILQDVAKITDAYRRAAEQRRALARHH